MLPQRLVSLLLLLVLILSLPLNVSRAAVSGPTPTSASHQDGTSPSIPEAAWSRAIGLPVDHAPRPSVNYSMINDGPVQGAPFGGFGAGTFSRTYAGDFARWHLDIGQHVYQTIPADMFSVYASQGDQSVAQALWTGKPKYNMLSAWNWEYPVGAGTYYALYPRSWFVYDWDQLPVDLSVEQFSPIIPDNYQETSYPIALFNWTASNPTDQPVTLGVMFTTQNLLGFGSGLYQTMRTTDTAKGKMVGIELRHEGDFTGSEFDGSLAIAALEVPGVSVSYRSRFDTMGDGADIWNDFAADGALDNIDDPTPSQRGEAPGAGLAVTITLEPGQRIEFPMTMTWDFPITAFKDSGAQWYKRYTAFFGREGNHAWDIAAEGLAEIDNWRSAIVDWQQPILDDQTTPLWYKTALFNELYYLADGGSVWEHGRVGEPDPGPDYFGKFAYLECPDYYWYNTFDVDFYASFALLELWPEIETQIMRDFAATIPQEDTSTYTVGYSGEEVQRKIAGAVPHDMGGPQEAPWDRPNGFTWQNVNTWKDLNAKFVLRLYRDAVLLDQPELVNELWADAVLAMDYLAAMDDNGDGIPENDGVPDQTYDTWPATGISAYSGGLWVAALDVMSKMAVMVGDDTAATTYSAQFEQAASLYESTLWTGEYYKYDETSDDIMTDQLAGEWYARISSLSTLPDDHVDSALNSVYTHNVMLFQDGQMGAVNGITPDGKATNTQQGDEVWSGTTYMAAAHMLLRGLDDDGWNTAYGVYKYTYEDYGMWFRTPEAWVKNGNFRASMYMRPLAIWAMQTALEHR